MLKNTSLGTGTKANRSEREFIMTRPQFFMKVVFKMANSTDKPRLISSKGVLLIPGKSETEELKGKVSLKTWSRSISLKGLGKIQSQLQARSGSKERTILTKYNSMKIQQATSFFTRIPSITKVHFYRS